MIKQELTKELSINGMTPDVEHYIQIGDQFYEIEGVDGNVIVGKLLAILSQTKEKGGHHGTNNRIL